MCELTEHDFENPIRKGRASWFCSKCGEDISLMILLLEEAKMEELDLDEERVPECWPSGFGFEQKN